LNTVTTANWLEPYLDKVFILLEELQESDRKRKYHSCWHRLGVDKKGPHSFYCAERIYQLARVEVDKIRLEPKKTKWRSQDLFGSSIVEQTPQELEGDEEFQATNEELKSIGQEAMPKEERTKRRRALKHPLCKSTSQLTLQ
jgi:hypothetical protein